MVQPQIPLVLVSQQYKDNDSENNKGVSQEGYPFVVQLI